MPRTITSVINNLIQKNGKPHAFRVAWEIPVARKDGWKCEISIGLSSGFTRDDQVYISVHAWGWPNTGPYTGIADYEGLHGFAPVYLLTRKWIDHVLGPEIETARLACLSFTVADLRERSLERDDEEARADHLRKREYFQSTFER